MRQYRYGIDEVIIELPAGSIDRGEDPLDLRAARTCRRDRLHGLALGTTLAVVPAEPVRSNSFLHAFLAFDAVPTRRKNSIRPKRSNHSPSSLEAIWPMLRANEIGALSCVAVAYAALDRLGV